MMSYERRSLQDRLAEKGFVTDGLEDDAQLEALRKKVNDAIEIPIIPGDPHDRITAAAKEMELLKARREFVPADHIDRLCAALHQICGQSLCIHITWAATSVIVTYIIFVLRK